MSELPDVDVKYSFQLNTTVEEIAKLIKEEVDRQLEPLRKEFAKWEKSQRKAARVQNQAQLRHMGVVERYLKIFEKRIK